MNKIKVKYSLVRMIVFAAIGILGGMIFYSTNIFSIKNNEYLIEYLKIGFFIFGFCILLISISIINLIKYLKNLIMKPYNDILYLKEIKNNRCKLIDKKGKVYYCKNNNYEVNNYYNVLKTKDILINIKEISIEKLLISVEKKSYWEILYTPMQEIENNFSILILYTIILLCFQIIILLPGNFKIFGILISIYPLGLLIYDLIYKIRLNKGKPIEEIKVKNIIDVISKIINLLKVIILNIVLYIIYTYIENIKLKIIIIPFIIISALSFFKGITQFFYKDNIIKFISKSQKLVSFMCVIGFVSYLFYIYVKDGISLTLIFIIFILISFILRLYDEFFKKENKKNKEYTYNIINDVYNWMISKEKDIEVRILKEKSNQIQIGDIITFNNQDIQGKYVKVQVINKTIVKDIDELLSKFNVSRMMPHHTEEELKELMYNIYKEELNNTQIVAFEFKYLTSDID